MRKLPFVIFLCVLSSTVVANENDDSLLSVDVSQSQILELLNEESVNMDSLKILQENSEQYIQKNEEINEAQQELEKKQKKIEEEKVREKKQKRSNKPAYYLPFGLNTMSSYNNKTLYSIYDTPIPIGMSFGVLNTLNSWSFKCSFDFSFFKSLDKPGAAIALSLGRAPIRNDYLFFGYYLTWIPNETLALYSYSSVGATGTLIINFSERFGFYINVDATYRYNEEFNNEKVTDISNSFVNNTWRVCPSVGFALNLY